jgi:hypothetical protein
MHRSFFYLSRRLLDELLTVHDNDTLVVLVNLYTEEVVTLVIINSRNNYAENLSFVTPLQ